MSEMIQLRFKDTLLECKDRKLILYANDSTILYSHKNPENISVSLGKVLEGCSEWLVDNKSSLYIRCIFSLDYLKLEFSKQVKFSSLLKVTVLTLNAPKSKVLRFGH
ncbi:hypothetical protein ACF0H5_013249 [Mactra antiquata]